MKKYFIHLLLSVFIVTAFAFNFSIPTTSAAAQSMTISQFAELMISIGVVPADRVAAVRAMAVSLSANPVVTTSTATSSLPYIQVLNPNGGESWDMGVNVPYTINWGSSSKIPVTVSLITAKGAVCDLTTTPIASKNSDNHFNVNLKTAKCYNQITGTSTPLVDGTYKARVSYGVGTSTVVKDESNATFKITPVLIPSLKLTYPVGGENLIRGKDYVVKYKLANAVGDNDNLISFYLKDMSGNSVFNGHKLITTGNTFTLELPGSITPGAYKVELDMTTSKRVELQDISSNYFWISAAI